MNNVQQFTKGLIKENPALVLLLGMCPTLAVTSSAINGLAMGLATTFVLTFSNVVIASIKNLIPNKVRIAGFILVIATFVTIVDLVMKAWAPPAIYNALGVFIPLIVVNCIILGRAEAFASKNSVFHSLLDGLGMGVGFSLALFIMGSVREILGNGSILDIKFVSQDAKTILMFIMPPGAFITLGYLIAFVNKLKKA